MGQDPGGSKMGTDTEMDTDNIWTLFQHFVAEMLAIYFQQTRLSLFFSEESRRAGK